LQPIQEEGLPASLLAEAMEPLLREPTLPDSSHITSVAITLVEELRRLRVLLARDGGFSFHAVAPNGRLERAVTFFALLELHNRGEAQLRQTRAFADILVTPVSAVRAAAG
jgi:chromatin segregation and condensation protein Rec8/ScpA/Scc1 (kleisin family)